MKVDEQPGEGRAVWAPLSAASEQAPRRPQPQQPRKPPGQAGHEQVGPSRSAGHYAK